MIFFLIIFEFCSFRIWSFVWNYINFHIQDNFHLTTLTNSQIIVSTHAYNKFIAMIETTHNIFGCQHTNYIARTLEIIYIHLQSSIISSSTIILIKSNVLISLISLVSLKLDLSYIWKALFGMPCHNNLTKCL